MTHLVCLLLLVSSAAAIDISFSSSTYYSKVSTLEDPVGKVVVETQLVYNESLVLNFTTKDYSLYRTDGTYFSVDKNGVITLKRELRYRRVYIFQVSLLYTVTLIDNTTESKFLTADCRVQAIGPVYFDNSTYAIIIPTSLQPNDEVYDFSQHIAYNRSAFQSVYFEFDYVYSSYFSMEASTGVLYVRRALYPTTFSVRIEVEYDVTLKNGTIVSDNEYVYARITAVGCRGEEEIKAFWPETYPCSAFRIPCAELDNGNYFTNGTATRVCNSEGEWLAPDYSACTVKATAGSFALIWMTFSTTSGTYVLRQLERIISDIEDLFPANGVSDISPVSAFRSNVQYGFMIGFKMDVNTSAVEESYISYAQFRLSRAYRFGGLYMRSSRTIQGRGLRFFRGINSKCGSPQITDAKYLEVCSGKRCNCTGSTAINSNGSCDSVDLRTREDEEPPTISPNKTEPSYLSLNASDYYADISAFSPIGTYILTVSYNITGKSVAKIANFHYDLSGYYSDFFKIDRRQGYLTVKKQLYSSSRTYSFDVSFFYTVTYTNGTTANNYTESDIYVTAYAGIGFNASSYYITVDANYTTNQTVLITMANFLNYDDTFVVDDMSFYYISDSRFSLNPITGGITIIKHLDPLRYHYVRVYLRYNGTINTTKEFYESRTSTLVRIYTMGCFELENGNVVWPPSHVCTTAVHSCYDVDHSFNQSGMVTRYCSNTGQWQDPDYSQCFLKPGTKPFVHLYLTFYTLSYPHIRNNLANIIRSGNSLLSRLNVSDLAVYSLKESVVRYGMVVVLRGEATPNNTILTSINSTIYRSRSFARIRLQIIGNGIIGFNTSSQCEYPTYPSNALNFTTFTAVCQKGDNVSCECEIRNPTAGVCNATSTPTTSTPTTETPTTPTPVSLNVSAASVSNTSIGLQWSDDTPGVTNFEVRYSAVIQYNTTDGEATYVDTKVITTTDTSYMFTLLNPSTDYTFTVTSYTKDGESYRTTLSQTTMEGRKENPSFVELLFNNKQDCTNWGKDSELIEKVVDAMITNILPYCKCQYTREYVKVWYVKCRKNLDDGTSDIILIAQLMPTNLYSASYMMQAMSQWVASSGAAGMDINGELIRVDQSCKVQIDHPYGRDCSEVAPANTGAQNQFSTNNDDDDNNSAGAAVGGVIAGLVIICVTIVVLVVVVMLLRRQEKKQPSQKPEIPSSSYSADTMKVQLSDDF